MKYIHYIKYLPLVLLMGCAPYVGGYYYEPHPGLVQIPATQPTQQPTLSALATIVGIRYEDDRVHLPESVELRLRLDNTGDEPVTFDPRSMNLSSGDLLRFLPAIANPPEAVMIPPGQSTWFVANFPFPPGTSYGQFDLSALQLRWTVQTAGKSQDLVIDFRRSAYPYGYYGPYWAAYPYPYPFPIFRGVVVVGHR